MTATEAKIKAIHQQMRTDQIEDAMVKAIATGVSTQVIGWMFQEMVDRGFGVQAVHIVRTGRIFA